MESAWLVAVLWLPLALLAVLVSIWLRKVNSMVPVPAGNDTQSDLAPRVCDPMSAPIMS